MTVMEACEREATARELRDLQRQIAVAKALEGATPPGDTVPIRINGEWTPGHTPRSPARP